VAFTRKPILITRDGETLLMYGWEAKLGISQGAIYARWARGERDPERLLAKVRKSKGPKRHVRVLGGERTLCGRSVFEVTLGWFRDADPKRRATCRVCLDAVYGNLGDWLFKVRTEDEWTSHHRDGRRS
jgi:hypothetical protein